MENNLAFTDFVELQRTAAQFVERNYSSERIATVWPLSQALRRPEFGYVQRPLAVRAIGDFTARTVDSPGWQQDAQVLVIFSRMWEPDWSWSRFAWVRRLWHDYYGYEPDLTAAEMAYRPWRPVATWQRRGQWIAVYEVSTGTVVPALWDRSAESGVHRYR